MTKMNYIGMIGFDEVFIGNYNRVGQGTMYMSGFEPGSPEYLYRGVFVGTRFIEGGYFKKPGEFGHATAAIVPDHIPTLKAWDIVELRQTGTFYTLKDFSKTGEGNAIVRVLCRKAQADYEACAEALPRIGEYRAQGPTGTRYPPSLKDYGFAFSPAYTVEGKPLR